MSFSGRSTTITILITRVVAAMYNIIGSFSIGAASTGAVDNIRLRTLNASYALGVHMNLSVFFINWYKGIAFSPSRLRNRLSDARQPVNFFTSFRFLGLFIRSIAAIFYELHSIPLSDTRNPSSLPAGTPNTHFYGLSLILYMRRFANVSLRSSSKVDPCIDLTTRSSTYT